MSQTLHDCLKRVAEGNEPAREELLRHVSDRLLRLTRKMLRDFPGVHRWEETDDVFQSAVLRLLKSLRDVHPRSATEFFGLASLQIRRQLLDLARHYYGPQGAGAQHATAHDGSTPEQADLTHEPSRLSELCEFHEKVDRLEAEERDVVGLIYYQGLTQIEAAEILGVSVRTVQRRWNTALLQLHPSSKEE